MGPTSERQCVVVAELQCVGFEHAHFNAALLHTVRLAYPASRIIFFGEAAHLGFLREALDRIDGADGIDFRTIGIPDGKSLGWGRLPVEFASSGQVLAGAASEEASALILCSVTNTGLIALKLLMRIKRFKLPTVTIVHGCLSGITGRQPHRPWNWLLRLKHGLALPHPRNMRLVVLGDSILKNVQAILPRWKSQWSSLDLVYLWPLPGAGTVQASHSTSPPVRFGYLGVSGKGLNAFCQLAQDIAPAPEIAQFMMVGFYQGPAREKPVCRYVSQIPDQPLSRKEFEDRLGQLSYVVWTAKPDHYRLTASATFLDAMASLKPGVYIRNDYIESYFERMGDIGYLCDSYEEMVAIIRELITKFPAVRYQRQVENIRKGRVIFAPETQAPRLREIVESCAV